MVLRDAENGGQALTRASLKIRVKKKKREYKEKR